MAPIIDEASPEGRALLASGVTEQFEIGALLFSEGNKIDRLVDIISGTVSVSRFGLNGRRQILGFMGARQFLGAASTPRYPNSVKALTKVEAIVYPKEKVNSALATSPEFSAHFRELLVKIIESRDDHIFTIGQRSAPERVASFLLHLRTNQARFAPGGPREKSQHIDLPMSRVDIGDYLGVSVETISRAFSWLKQKGMIDFSDSNHCEILQLDQIYKYGGRDDFTEYRGGAL